MTRERRLGVKEVIEELGVSRTTFWRARASGIDGFPEPFQIGGLLFWRREDLGALEAAILQYRGRCKFEGQRRHARVVAARGAASRRKRNSEVPTQQTLFDFEGGCG